MSCSPMLSRSVLALAAVGLAWRLALAPHIYAAVRPGTPAAGDAELYLGLAGNLLAGHGYTTDAAPPHRPFVLRPPGYPLFLAGVLGLSGGSHAAVVVLQVLLDLATGFLLGLLARRLWPARPRLPAIVFGLWALCPALGSNAGRFLAEILAAFLVTGGVVLLAEAVAAAGRRRAPLGVAAGATLMLAVLTRPQLVPVVILLPLLIAAFGPRAARGPAAPGRGRGGHVRLLAAAALGVVLVEGPWLARNLRATGEPIVLSRGLGELVLALGVSGEPRGEPMAEAMQRLTAAGAVLTGDHARDRDQYLRFAVDRIREHPGRYLGVSLKRAVLLWATPRTAVYGVTPGAALRAMRHPLRPGSAAPFAVFGLFSLYYGMLLLVAALGVFHARRDLALWAILIALPLGLTALNMWVYLEARNMLPSYPAVVLAAALGFETWLASPDPRWAPWLWRRSRAGTGARSRGFWG